MARLNKALTTKIENFAISLLDAAEKDTVTADSTGQELRIPVSLAERVKVFEAVVKYQQMIHRLEGDDDDDRTGGIGDLAKQLRAATGSGSRRRASSASEEGDGDDFNGRYS